MDLIFLEIFQLMFFIDPVWFRRSIEELGNIYFLQFRFNFFMEDHFCLCFLHFKKGHKYIYACILGVGLSVEAMEWEGEGDWEGRSKGSLGIIGWDK